MRSRWVVSFVLLILLAPGLVFAQSKGDAKAGKAMKALSDKYLFDIIKNGGASQKKSPIMPGSGKKFNDQEISDMVAYIRSLAK